MLQKSKKPYSLEIASFERTMLNTKVSTYWHWKSYDTLRGVLDAYKYFKENEKVWKFKNGNSKYWHSMENKFRIVHNYP